MILNKTSPVMRFFKKSSKKSKNNGKDGSRQELASYSSSVRTSATADDLSDTSSSHQRTTTPVVEATQGEAQNSNHNEVTTSDYGYGDAQPDSASSTNSNSADVYGYGDASPDNAHHDYASYGHNHSACSGSAGGSSRIQHRDYASYGDEEDDLAKYGYGAATPDSSNAVATYGDEEDDLAKYGYGEATPDSSNAVATYGDEEDDLAKYGYGEATPDSSNVVVEGGHHDFASYGAVSKGHRDLKKQSSASSDDDRAKYGYRDEQQSSTDDDDRAKYGYGDEQLPSPDDDAAAKYGYGDEKQSSPNNDDAKYGYGDATPDSDKYGYGDGSPTPDTQRRTKTPRRSSLKASGAPPRRRASLQFGKGAEIEVVVPDGSYEGKKVKRRNSITFNDTARVRRVAPTKSLTDEPEKLWFQKDEFHTMRQKAFAIIDRVESNGGAQASLNGKKLCTRGLERYIGPKKEEVSGRRSQAWDSVLDEQGLQRCNNEFNDEHIANVYKYTTMHTQQEANARALQDAAEVEGYLKKTRRACRRMSM